MTEESHRDTEPWIKSKGVTYAYGYDKGAKLDRFFGIQGIPHAILIDASGKIVWRGHPASLEPSIIDKALAGALTKPLYEMPASAKALKTAIQKRQWAEALSAASKLSEADGGPMILNSLQALVAARAKAARTAYDAGNFLVAQDSANELAKSLSGLPEKADIDKLLADLKANKDAAKVIAAQVKVRAIREAGLKRSKEIDSAIEDLKRIAKDSAGTYAATEATELIDQLNAAKRAAK